MRLVARIGIGCVALCCATGAAAQTFNETITRYRTAQAVCAETYQERVAARCNAACKAGAAARQTSCLAKAEKRYRAAIRRELRLRR